MSNESIVTESSIVVKEQYQIEVFPNENGGITIRATNSSGDENMVAFDALHAERIISAIRCAYQDLQDCEE